MRHYRIPPLILQTSIWIPSWIVLKFFINFKVKGVENLKDLGTPVIFASNHVSELDPILIPAALPFLSRHMPMFYISRKSYIESISGFRKYLYGGLFFKSWGAYPVYSGQKSYEISLAQHIKLLKEGNSVCIFPEGRMSDDGTIKEAHGGVGYLAFTTGAPVVPVAVSGAHKITLKDFFIKRNRQITLTFGEPVYLTEEIIGTKNPEREHYLKLAEHVMGYIKKHLSN